MTDDKAREIAHGLIQSYIGPDHKMIDKKAFVAALANAESTHDASKCC
jgi:hypothetical protein